MSRESFIAFLVSAVWATVVISSLFLQQFTVLEAVTPVMLIVAGFLFGRRSNGKDKDK